MNDPLSVSGFRIRQATAQDCALILSFIRQLAEYEKLAHEVVATVAGLQHHLFGPESRAEVLIGEVDGQPAGFALYFHNFSTFVGKPGIYLEDLFVKQEFRGRGLGKALLQTLAGIARQRECGRLEWCVLDWNTPAIDFYKSLGAEFKNGWIINRLSGEALDRLAEPARE